MKALASRFRHIEDDSGAALPFIAILMFLLLGMSAFAVDLGWAYLNGARLQRGADAAALAGVVYLPSDTTGAVAQAVNGAEANGWDIGVVNGVSNGTGGTDELEWSALDDNKLEIVLDATVGTFFLKALGFDSFDISRTATAEYVKPVPLGSPANCFGIGSTSHVGTGGLVSGTGASTALSLCESYTQNFWGAINGERTGKENGDPYSVECITATTSGGCTGTNTDYRGYYYYGIEVPAGQSWLDVYIYDFGFYDRSSFAETGDEQSLVNSDDGGTHTTFTLYDPDDSPTIPTNNTTVSSCSSGTNPRTVNSEADSGTYRNLWSRLCRVATPSEGIYVLKLANSGNLGGNNGYAILANSSNLTTTSFPRVYAINDMSIFTNAPSGTATIYLAEVEPIHAGKTLELKFFDPGEGSGNASMTVQAPPGVTGISCSWTATNGSSGSSCSIPTTVSGVAQFNSHWITMQIDIPSAYTCSTDCYWKVNAALNTSHDRTTWTAKVIGNPVHLVPNQ